MIEKKLFGKLPDGREVDQYTLTNEKGSKISIINFGATVTSIIVPDRNGKYDDVVLGYDSLEGYVKDKSYLGVIVGRYGNRIGKGKFSIDGKEYQVTVNDGENHLHGGNIGFHKVLWDAMPIENSFEPVLLLSYISKDGEDGYPGNVLIKVKFILTVNNELKIEYEGTTDVPTILNPTHHSYFNLTGAPINTITGHFLKIESDSLTPVDKGLITTGEIIPIANTPMDFRAAPQIGKRINEPFEQLVLGKGYDHNWVIRGDNGTLRKAAEVFEPNSGRILTVFTDQAGLQFYSGNFLDGSIKGKKGVVYQHRTGFCLEPQAYPDSPNKVNFHNVILEPNNTYRQTTIYQFSTK